MTGYRPVPSPGRYTSVASLTPSPMATICVVAFGAGGSWPGQTLATVARARIARPHHFMGVTVRQVILMADVTWDNGSSVQKVEKRSSWARRSPDLLTPNTPA